MTGQSRQFGLRVTCLVIYLLFGAAMPGGAVVCLASDGHVALETPEGHCPQTAREHGHETHDSAAIGQCDSSDCFDTPASLGEHNLRAADALDDALAQPPLPVVLPPLPFDLTPQRQLSSLDNPPNADGLMSSLRCVVLLL